MQEKCLDGCSMLRNVPASSVAAPSGVLSPHPAHAATMPSKAEMLLILGSITGLSCGYSGLYFGSVGVFLKPIASALSWNRAEISTVSLISLLAFAICSPLAGLLADRFGARLVAGAAFPFFALGLLALSYMPGSLAVFALTSCLTGLFGVATGPVVYLSTIPRWFNAHLGLALSLAMVGVGLGSIAAPMVAELLIKSFGWREAYRWFALIAFAGGGMAWLLYGAAERLKGAPIAVARQPKAKRGTFAMTDALGDRRFWLIAAALFAVSAAAVGANVHFVAMLTDRGISPVEASHVYGAVGLGILIGRIATGYLMDRIFAPIVGAAAFLVGGLGILLVALNVSGLPLVLAFSGLMFGLTIGAEGDFAAFVTRRYFGVHAFATIYGILLGVYAFGGFVGALLIGLGYDHFKGYEVVMLIAATSCAVSAVAVLALGRYRFAYEPELETSDV